MFIFLYLLLVLLSIALKISSMGIELSYQVYKRADSIRQNSEDKLVAKSLEGSSVGTKKAVTALKKGVDTPLELLNTGVDVVSKGAIYGARFFVKFIKIVLSILRKIIFALSMMLLLLDIIVFLVIVICAYVYLYILS